ncbi:GntR family transcriptional regulator [Streptacidiphilus anmyonensis]|uniref:GntR family transcriptional regulator n=1 Tax=Streptacidiphilus anmyonensis TaxID=405782 RepID=UPI0005AABD2C|nr:GntR family transcriptional regulator [Streptacidiphilus anmyonensis]
MAQAGYQRVAHQLRLDVASGLWAADQALPSQARLAGHYQAGEGVVRRALALLADEGVLQKAESGGAFLVLGVPQVMPMVRPWPHERTRPALGVSPAHRPDPAAWEQGAAARTPAPVEVAAALETAPGAPCWRSERWYAHDGRRLACSVTWTPLPALGSVAPRDGAADSQAAADLQVASRPLVTSHVTESPRPVLLDSGQARELGAVAGSLATLIQRVVYDTGARPVRVVEDLVPAQHWRIVYRVPHRRH